MAKRAKRTTNVKRPGGFTITENHIGYKISVTDYKQDRTQHTVNISLDEDELPGLIREILLAIDAKEKRFTNSISCLRTALRYSTSKAVMSYNLQNG
jgi:hypothetical protein